MLVINRDSGEGITIFTSDGPIRVIVEMRRGKIKLAFNAPKDIRIVRDELLKKDGTNDNTERA